MQVGSWQRSDHRFRLAVEMVRQGASGKLQQVDVVLGKNVDRRPFPQATRPEQLELGSVAGPDARRAVHRRSVAITRSAGGTNTPADR